METMIFTNDGRNKCWTYGGQVHYGSANEAAAYFGLKPGEYVTEIDPETAEQWRKTHLKPRSHND
jgi:hypothetical protein